MGPAAAGGGALWLAGAALQGNGLTDFWKAGGDLRAWVTYHLGKLDALPRRSTVEAQAKAILARLGDDPQAAREYAELAQAQGWPCAWGSWSEWAAEGSGDNGES